MGTPFDVLLIVTVFSTILILDAVGVSMNQNETITEDEMVKSSGKG